MPKIKINKVRCKGCYLCVVNCPNGLIKISADMNVKGVKPAFFKGTPDRQRRSGRCSGCSMCAVICPDCGIVVYK